MLGAVLATAAGMDEAMVRQDGDVPTEVWADDRGELGFRTLVGRSRSEPGPFTAGIADLAPGGWLGRHRHEQAEVYHVLRGRGTVTLGDREVEVGPGSTVLVPGGTEHAVRAVGDEP